MSASEDEGGLPSLEAAQGGRYLRVLGLFAALFYAAHAGWHIAHGHPWDLLWACNVSMPVLIAGCFLRSARLVAATFMILMYGTPIWILDLMTGSNMVLTSPLVHFGGPVLAALAARRLGWPKSSWIVAGAITLAALFLSRLITPSSENVNLAFRVHQGWERYFSSHPVYVALMWTSSTFVFFVVELVARRVLLPSAIRARD